MDIQVYTRLDAPLVSAKDTNELISVWLYGKPDTTVEAYKNDVQEFFIWTGNLPVNLLTVEILQGYATHLRNLILDNGLPYRINTRQRKMASLRSFLAFAYKARIVQTNIAEFVPSVGRPTGEEEITRVLGEAEVLLTIYLESKSDNRFATRNARIIKFLYHTGLRVTELVSLKWSDITPTEKGANVRVLGKGNKIRTINIQKSLLEELNIGRSDKSVYVFSSQCSKDGYKFDRNTIYIMIKRAFERAGVTKFASTHWLRHCCASHALQRGAPLNLVKETLGHSNVATTSRYLHSNNEEIGKYLP